MSPEAVIAVRDLTMAYEDFVIQRNLNFEVFPGDIFIIMGGSGCGKSTLLRHMVGLKEPQRGKVEFRGRDLWSQSERERNALLRECGVMYQYGALWSSMTLAENISLPLEEYTELSEKDIRDLARLKLSLVGLDGFEDFYPAEVSGGMRKRAALARALALDPKTLFVDEPSAGLDPLSSRNLDELILTLRDALGVTFIVVTHELPSIFAIGSNGVFLDADSKTMLAAGSPQFLLKESGDERIERFLTRGETVTQPTKL